MNTLLQKTAICIFSCILFLNIQVTGQMNMSFEITFSDTIEVNKYKAENKTCKKIRVKPGDFRIINTTKSGSLNDEAIVQIDLVYNHYPQGNDFTGLNRKRLVELYRDCPNAFNQQTIKWRLVKQTGAKKRSALSKYFEGFVVYYRPNIPFSAEKEYLADLLAGKRTLVDSTLIKVFTRNTHWNEMLCVVDVTGSMSPYTAQLLVWAKFNEKLRTFKQFVFFNDNDVVSNDQSAQLDTSGIWDIETFHAETIMNKMLYSMEHGDHTENNLEAIFYAVKKYPGNIKNIVLIADNWENPCDMYLLSRLTELHIPVRVVVCGAQDDMINMKYLEIARETNGSVHTMEEDLTEMGKLNEGEIFKLGSLMYLLKNGQFIQVR